MKTRMKLLVFAAFCSTFLTLGAQTEKGDWLAGGQFELNTVEKNSRFLLNPNAGYFFLDHLALGATLNIDFEKVGETRFTSLGVGPFARFYFGRGPWRPFLNANANVASQRTKLGSASSTVNGFSWLAGAGVAWFVTDNAALETTFGYSSTKYQKQDANDGLAFRVGFQVYFDRFAAEKMGIRTR